MRVLLCAPILGSYAWAAEPPIAVTDLVSVLLAALATDPGDQRTARLTGNVRRSQRVTGEMIGPLKQKGWRQ